jgi:hypothetical protein
MADSATAGEPQPLDGTGQIGGLAVQTFAIAPAGMKALWLVLLVLASIAALLTLTMVGARTARFELSDEGLRLRGDLYGRVIPASELRGSAARRVDFGTMPELTPARRTLGTGLPGYQAGWFRLRNGEKALLYLTDRNRAVYVPTTAGYSVLLSPADPDAFLAALRRIRK